MGVGQWGERPLSSAAPIDVDVGECHGFRVEQQQSLRWDNWTTGGDLGEPHGAATAGSWSSTTQRRRVAGLGSGHAGVEGIQSTHRVLLPEVS